MIRPVFFPNGVAQPDASVGFVADRSGHIDAIELSTGGLLWQSSVDARPLIVLGGRLAVLKPGDAANALCIDVLDTSSAGRLLFESAPIVFPDWVVASVEPDESFQYAVVGDATALSFTWDAQGRYRGGAAPPPHVRTVSSTRASGTVTLELDTARMTMMPSEGRRDPDIPDAVKQSMWHTTPWEVNDSLAAVTGELDGEHQTLHLHRWHAGSGASEQRCMLMTGDALVPTVTGDGRYLLIHSERAFDRGASARSPWWIFDVTACAQIAVHEYEPGTREPSILGSQLYFIVDSTLRCADLISGAPLWQRPLAPPVRSLRPPLRQ